ncbi:hypothetical protein TNCV_239811 [Trichonephila clavipes]|nr:hypothetical protein TNCV_239811 [Trichonephila clavipes]
MDSDGIQKLLDSHNQELTMDELIEMHEQKQDIEEFEYLDPVQSEDLITAPASSKNNSYAKLYPDSRDYHSVLPIADRNAIETLLMAAQINTDFVNPPLCRQLQSPQQVLCVLELMQVNR